MSERAAGANEWTIGYQTAQIEAQAELTALQTALAEARAEVERLKERYSGTLVRAISVEDECDAARVALGAYEALERAARRMVVSLNDPVDRMNAASVLCHALAALDQHAAPPTDTDARAVLRQIADDYHHDRHSILAAEYLDR